MSALESRMLPSIAGAQELLNELSPRGLELNLECLQRMARSFVRTLAPQARV